MACRVRSSTPSKASLAQKGKRSSEKVSSSSAGRPSLTSVLPNSSLMRSTRLTFAWVLFVTVILVNIRTTKMLTPPSRFSHLCRKMSLLNGSFLSQTLAIASASEWYEKRLNTFVVGNLAKSGSVAFFHVTLRSSLESHQALTPNGHRCSVVPPSHITLTSLRQSSRSMISPLRIFITWTRKASSVGVVARLRHRSTLFHIASIQSANFIVPILNLSQLLNVL